MTAGFRRLPDSCAFCEEPWGKSITQNFLARTFGARVDTSYFMVGGARDTHVHERVTLEDLKTSCAIPTFRETLVGKLHILVDFSP